MGCVRCELEGTRGNNCRQRAYIWSTAGACNRGEVPHRDAVFGGRRELTGREDGMQHAGSRLPPAAGRAAEGRALACSRAGYDSIGHEAQPGIARCKCFWLATCVCSRALAISEAPETANGRQPAWGSQHAPTALAISADANIVPCIVRAGCGRRTCIIRVMQGHGECRS